MTCSTSKGRRRIWARPRARTPLPPSPRILRCTASTRRAGWPTSASRARWLRSPTPASRGTCPRSRSGWRRERTDRFDPSPALKTRPAPAVGRTFRSGSAGSRKLEAVKQRLDTVLVERGLAASRERARAMILAGKVRVGGVVIAKAGHPTGADADVRLIEPDHPYVSRGGVKLAHALDV